FPRSVIASTTVAPFSASLSVFERVRFHTRTSLPASTRWVAIASPIRPVPSHPSTLMKISSFRSIPDERAVPGTSLVVEVVPATLPHVLDHVGDGLLAVDGAALGQMAEHVDAEAPVEVVPEDRKSTRLKSRHVKSS